MENAFFVKGYPVASEIDGLQIYKDLDFWMRDLYAAGYRLGHESYQAVVGGDGQVYVSIVVRMEKVSKPKLTRGQA